LDPNDPNYIAEQERKKNHPLRKQLSGHKDMSLSPMARKEYSEGEKTVQITDEMKKVQYVIVVMLILILHSSPFTKIIISLRFKYLHYFFL